MSTVLVPEKELKVVGTSPVRPDGVPKVTGLVQYGADFSLPGMLWGKILRSPHAHARIRSIDTSKAEALKGVKAVMTHKDLPDQKFDYLMSSIELVFVDQNVFESEILFSKNIAIKLGFKKGVIDYFIENYEKKSRDEFREIALKDYI